MSKTDNFAKKQIDYEDDIVVVYDASGKCVYKGSEDFEPMKDCDWKWNNKKEQYEYDEYIKICLDI